MLIQRLKLKHLGKLLFVVALTLMVHALYMPTKALAAQYLLERAWQLSQTTGKLHKPWPWADTVTMGRIHFPAFQQSYIVLSGNSGRTLAFAPGHLDGSKRPGEEGHTVISGHRDSHFAILEHLQIGDELVIETLEGEHHFYEITNRRVVDSRSEQLHLDHNNNRLTLVTCYPFDSIQVAGPLRLRIDARRHWSF